VVDVKEVANIGAYFLSPFGYRSVRLGALQKKDWVGREKFCAEVLKLIV
jgi:hypothetical protein